MNQRQGIAGAKVHEHPRRDAQQPLDPAADKAVLAAVGRHQGNGCRRGLRYGLQKVIALLQRVLGGFLVGDVVGNAVSAADRSRTIANRLEPSPEPASPHLLLVALFLASQRGANVLLDFRDVGVHFVDVAADGLFGRQAQAVEPAPHRHRDDAVLVDGP